MAQINLTNTKISPECFDLILQFMYLGKIMKAPENFEQLKHAMTYLQMYVIPDCLEEIQDIDSSVKCSSSASSSSSSSKMVFGVRMYEESTEKTGEEPGKWTSETVLAGNTVQEKQVEHSLPHHSRQSTRSLCKKTPLPKVHNTRERGTRRFGRSYTCEGCGFVFSCEKLLNEHSQTCTNRLFFNSREQTSNDHSQSGSESPVSKFSPSQDNVNKVDSSQPTDEVAESSKDSGAASDQRNSETIDTTKKNPVIIKIESDENSLAEMDDINIVKISDKDYLESSDIDDLDDEADEGAYYIGIPCNQKMNDNLATNSQQMFAGYRKDSRCSNRKRVNATERMAEISCELCGLTLNEQDLSSHYLAKHIENICACGKCGQILVKGRQLQEHAQRCGEPQESFDHERSMDERVGFDDDMEETGGVGEVLVDMWDDLNEGALGLPKQVYKHSSCPYRCPNCGQRFESENQVVEHMSQCMEHDVFRNSVSDDNDRDHRRKHFCDICGKGFYQRCHLREHYTVHTKEKQFVCQTCGKQFLRERQLRLHNDMHTGMARYVCSLCDQGNFRKHDHVRHMISHLAAGETICQVCFQIFPNNDQLEQHMDIHLYTCGVCGAKFNLRKDMRAHYNSKHFKKA